MTNLLADAGIIVLTAFLNSTIPQTT